MINFTKISQLKGLKLKNKGHTNFYECCDLTNKVYLKYIGTSTYMSSHIFYGSNAACKGERTERRNWKLFH